MQRSGTEAIGTQIQLSKPKREITNITNSQNSQNTNLENNRVRRWPQQPILYKSIPTADLRRTFVSY